jgi:hypothetical protein
MNLLPVLQALRFNNRDTAALEAIPRSAWPALLHAADAEGLTLPLGLRCRGLLPAMVEARIAHNLENNAARHERLSASYAQVAAALQARGIPFVLLKGLSKTRYYVADLRYRPQYDIDIYCPESGLASAREAIEGLGYEAMRDTSHSETDHLPRMVRKTGWKWREDYFDPEMPTAIELHFQFWNPTSEGFSVGDLKPFWDRRVIRNIATLQLPALSEVDALTYSALHLVRHLLHGALQFQHIYEMAHFLESSAADDTFWNEWEESGLVSCRVVEGIAFRLAAEWFHCRLHPAASRAVAKLPNPVQLWFQMFGTSPTLTEAHPGKNELLLHLCLMPESRNRRRIVMRRLLPTRRGRVVRDAGASRAGGALMKLQGVFYEAAFMLKRGAYHTRSLAAMAWSGFRWWRALS